MLLIFLTRVYVAPQLGVILLEFYRDLWCQKTRFTGLSCGFIGVICLAVLVELRLMVDTQTPTDRHGVIAYTALA